MRIPRLPTLLVGTLCLAAPLAAQESENPYLGEVDERPDRRGPFHASLGVGFGGEAIAGLGANVGEQLRLGLEGFAWFNLTNVGLTLTFDGHD